MIEDQEGFDTWEDSFKEDETNIDLFFQCYKWIRYTYDFGDDWMFTITVQNISEISEKITPNVIKEKDSIEQYPEWDEEEDDYE